MSLWVKVSKTYLLEENNDVANFEEIRSKHNMSINNKMKKITWLSSESSEDTSKFLSECIGRFPYINFTVGHKKKKEEEIATNE